MSTYVRWLRGMTGAWLILLSSGAAAEAPAEASLRWRGLTATTFRNLTHDTGLPGASEPTTFAQDGAGFVWIGSQDGLMRWDGYRFHRFSADPGDPGALPDSYVTALHADREGRLWVGGNVGGLSLHEPRHDRFIRYGGVALQHASVSAIADDANRGLWIGSDAGLHHLDPTSGRTVRVPLAVPGGVTSLACDERGVLWIGMASGLWRRSATGVLAKAPPVGHGEPEIHPTALAIARGGDVWVGTSQHGAYVVRSGAGPPLPLIDKSRGGPDLRTEGVNTLVEVGAGEIWLGTSGQGLVAVDTATMRTRRIRHDPFIPSTLPDDTVLNITRDRAGLVWIATNQGLSLYNPQQTAFATVVGPSTAAPRLENGDVRSVAVTSDGHVWLALGSNGVDVLDPVRGRLARLSPDGARAEHALAPAPIYAIAAAPGGAVYIGGARGLYRSDLSARSVRRVAALGRDPTQPVRAVTYHDGVLWVGQDGLYGLRLDARGTPTGQVLTLEGKLSDPRVAAMAAGPDGTLWVGTHDGLDRIDRRRVVETILPDPGDPHGLTPGGVTGLLTDRRGRLWVSSTGGGIAILTGRDAHGRPRFERLGVRQGLPNANVDDLLLAADGAIWASTDDGLARIDQDTLRVLPLGRADGVFLGNYWAGAGAATPAGELLFGAVGGLSIVRPARLRPWVFQPAVVVTSVEIAGRSSPPFDAVRSGGGIRLGPHSNTLTVEFAALDYSAPELNRYAYRLIGYDPAWIETDATRRIARYTNLAPGGYTLRLRGSSRTGAWSGPTLDLPLWVAAAWWQTLWFRAAAAVAVVGVVGLLLYARTSILERRQRELEQQVVDRTRELRESQRELEKMAYSDPLTGLPNRRMFSDNCRRLIADARRTGRRFAMLLIDLDHFKSVNDTLGHDAGDALLVESAKRLHGVARASDYLARLGGDEFAMLLSDIDCDDWASEAICRRIVEAFEPSTLFAGRSMHTSPSIGVAFFPEAGESDEHLYKSADLALYAAKRGGRNTWRVHESAKDPDPLSAARPASPDRARAGA